MEATDTPVMSSAEVAAKLVETAELETAAWSQQDLLEALRHVHSLYCGLLDAAEKLKDHGLKALIDIRFRGVDCDLRSLMKE